MSRFKSIRIDDVIRRLITAMMIAENCTESEAIRRLILDGARAQRPRPVIAQVGQPADLKKFSAQLMQWQQDFQSVRARLAMAEPDPKDTALCASVAKWRALAEKLEPQARALAVLADDMAKVLTGLDYSACERLAVAKRETVERIKRLKNRLAADLSIEEREETVKLFQTLEVILDALQIFAV